MRKSQAILLIILLAIVGLGGWAFQESQSASYYQVLKAPKEVVVKFQKLAQASCECTRSTDDKNVCWSEFNAANGVVKSEFATACGLGSVSGVCFDTVDGEACVTTGFGVNGVCSAKESLAVQAAHSAAYHKVMAESGFPDAPDWNGMSEQEEGRRNDLRPHAHAAADKAVEAVVAKLRRGEEVEPSGEGVGCAG